MQEISVADAKAKLAGLIHQVEAGAPRYMSRDAGGRLPFCSPRPSTRR